MSKRFPVSVQPSGLCYSPHDRADENLHVPNCDVCCPCCLVLDTCTMCRDNGVKAIYSGHDHSNDFVAHWNGTRLAYGCACVAVPCAQLLCPCAPSLVAPFSCVLHLFAPGSSHTVGTARFAWFFMVLLDNSVEPLALKPGSSKHARISVLWSSVRKVLFHASHVYKSYECPIP